MDDIKGTSFGKTPASAKARFASTHILIRFACRRLLILSAMSPPRAFAGSPKTAFKNPSDSFLSTRADSLATLCTTALVTGSINCECSNSRQWQHISRTLPDWRSLT